jgi:Na+-translocating ferredoxin:NAD+ oxidoreductase subunit B
MELKSVKRSLESGSSVSFQTLRDLCTESAVFEQDIIHEWREVTMNDEAYHKLARVLDTLPNGFPATESGIEIRILKKIFTPEEAILFCDLRLTEETAAEIAKRTGRPVEGLEEKLVSMGERGEIWAFQSSGVWKFRMAPWVVGIYELQLKRMDREFAKMSEEYSMYWGADYLRYRPQVMQVIPIEKEIPIKQEALTYQQVTNLIEQSNSFVVNECICKKKQGLLGSPCTKPLEVCLAMDPEPGRMESNPLGGKAITRDEAYEVLRKAEDAGLVHLTTNVESGHWFICNCCGCCCGVLRAVIMGFPQIVNSHYYAVIDSDKCSACGLCADERCQVKAIKKDEDFCSVMKEKCIGCGLCATTCPEDAISLVHKEPQDLIYPPRDEDAWLEERARQRGVDFKVYK